MAGRATDRGGSRRGELLEIATRHFALEGYAGATTRDIAREANMWSGSLYYYFKSKEQMAEEVIDRYWIALFARTDEILETDLGPPEKLARLITVTLLLDDWQILASALPSLLDNMDKLEAKWTTVLRDGIDTGEFRPDLDLRLTYRSIMASINGMNRWFKPGLKTSMAQVAATQVNLWLQAVRNAGETTPNPPASPGRKRKPPAAADGASGRG